MEDNVHSILLKIESEDTYVTFASWGRGLPDVAKNKYLSTIHCRHNNNKWGEFYPVRLFLRIITKLFLLFSPAEAMLTTVTVLDQSHCWYCRRCLKLSSMKKAVSSRERRGLLVDQQHGYSRRRLLGAAIQMFFFEAKRKTKREYGVLCKALGIVCH